MRRPYLSTYFSPDRGAAQVVIGFIDRAEHTLDCAVYCLTHDEMAAALIRAHQRGVRVRVVLDKTLAGQFAADVGVLAAAGVPVRLSGAGTMHAKYAVCDHKRDGKWAVLSGSLNWTARADERNVEQFQVARLASAVGEFAAHFETLWNEAR